MAQRKPLTDLEKRRRGRNLALLLILVGAVALFYVLSMVRVGSQL